MPSTLVMTFGHGRCMSAGHVRSDFENIAPHVGFGGTRLAMKLEISDTEDEREELKRGWLRSIRFHRREQMKREGRSLFRIEDQRRDWPGDPPVGPA